jgi:tetratricopeptide (TPR) repeat protein
VIEDYLVKSEDAFRDADCKTDIGYPMERQGWLAFFKGHYETAVKHFERAYENKTEIKSTPGKFQVRQSSVWALLYHGDIEGARVHLLECLELRPVLKSTGADTETLECAALYALKTGRPEDALVCLGAAFQQREKARNPRAKLYAAEVNKWETEARQQLTEDDASLAYQTGKSENLEKLFRKVEDWLKK